MQFTVLRMKQGERGFLVIKKTERTLGTIAASVNYEYIRNLHVLTVTFKMGKQRKMESMCSILWYTKCAPYCGTQNGKHVLHIVVHKITSSFLRS
jgi:hypothetical protein